MAAGEVPIGQPGIFRPEHEGDPIGGEASDDLRRPDFERLGVLPIQARAAGRPDHHPARADRGAQRRMRLHGLQHVGRVDGQRVGEVPIDRGRIHEMQVADPAIPHRTRCGANVPGMLGPDQNDTQIVQVHAG